MRDSDRRQGLSSLTNKCLPAIGAAALLSPLARGDAIGLSQLQALDPTLNGAGVRVAQVEATSVTAPLNFEVKPTDAFVNQPQSLFTYYSTNGTSATFGDTARTGSAHADTVAAYFYGTPLGVATNVSHVDNYEAGYFINNLVGPQVTVPAAVINQSFSLTDATGNPTQDPVVDQAYDNYIARYGKVVVSGAGDGGRPTSPSTSYNGIAVGAYGGSTAVGPTTDLRSKPDIVAPGGATSFTAPMVSGAAAILVQAGARGDGGNAASAVDYRVVKALLLNGATKPAGWTHTQVTPLDPTYGSGILNVFNSYQNLKAGFHGQTTASTTTIGGAHAPATAAFTDDPSAGWDLSTATSSTTTDAFNNYYFTLTAPTTLTATLDWERQNGKSTINNLDLYLYNIVGTTATLLDQSISAVDNVEQLDDATLPAGRYVIQVLKHGGPTEVSTGQTYALAYNFTATPEPGFGLVLLGVGVTAMGRQRGRRVRFSGRNSSDADTIPSAKAAPTRRP